MLGTFGHRKTINLFKPLFLFLFSDLMKGVSIPINTLVMLAVAIIVLLAAVAWFMGAFTPTATESSLKQRFDSSCMTWSMANCGGTSVPVKVCKSYRNLTSKAGSWDCDANIDTVAQACGCTTPRGTDRP